ncbi:MAG: chlorite dismutase family protein [Acidobacteriota bacterium]|nr:chlorite dismutase family protein [Acidobacteriota bacterium]
MRPAGGAKEKFTMAIELDLREKGALKNGERIFSDDRLFVQLQAFGGSGSSGVLIDALSTAPFESVLYEDIHDPRGVALLTWSRDPAFFVGQAREFLLRPPFSELDPKPEFTMLGRTYALGHEPDLKSWLIEKPRQTALNPDWPWAVWYPLRRAGSFSTLMPEEKAPILGEHGKIGHAFGEGNYAHDIRLASFGLDKNDNDFVIGLVGEKLFPISACVEAMRKTRQTSQYIQSMGPFFTGRAAWQSPLG